MENETLSKNIKEIFDGQYKYIVPLYQRNFAWRKAEIEQLLQDIYEAFNKNLNNSQSYNYYIGSLIVLKRINGDLEVIDGQQRLTALSLITKILGINKKPRLFYDSRPEVEDFFQAFYSSNDNICTIDYPQTFYLRNAIDIIKETNLDATGEKNIKVSDKDKKFVEYFANNVFLVRVEIPEDTDVASYFEIMNNRGVQLQKHEILKSLLIAKLDNEFDQKQFAQIWDACSQMDTPIQRAFNTAETRKKYFGEKYDIFIAPFEILDKAKPSNPIPSKSYSIEEIIIGNASKGFYDNNIDDDSEIEEDVSEYKSIIDFPNFLMHVLQLKCPNVKIPLNERYLLSAYDDIAKVQTIDPKDFINTLLFCRTVFDRYIVKTVTDKNDEDGIKWTLKKPIRYDKGWKFIDTFRRNSHEDNIEEKDSDEQKRIVKALSMLQVFVRAKNYKTWLYKIMEWFYTTKKWSLDVTYEEYINLLDEIILSNYKEFSPQNMIYETDSLSKENSYSLGTNTPHFLFNFIDYLYWVDSKKEKSIFGGKNQKKLEEFDFKYWNSVEHHLAQQYAKDIDKDGYTNYIDNLGNLCLISKNANSRLNDRSVQEKCERSKGNKMGPNRQIMYNETKNSDDTYTWDKEKIKKHYNEILELLSKRREILK